PHAQSSPTLSFPTRRSSDLTPLLHWGQPPRVREQLPVILGRRQKSDDHPWLFPHPRKRQHPSNGLFSADHIPPPRLLLVSYPPRSEEHTSELQSRENLVCRL